MPPNPLRKQSHPTFPILRRSRHHHWNRKLWVWFFFCWFGVVFGFFNETNRSLAAVWGFPGERGSQEGGRIISARCWSLPKSIPAPRSGCGSCLWLSPGPKHNQNLLCELLHSPIPPSSSSPCLGFELFYFSHFLLPGNSGISCWVWVSSLHMGVRLNNPFPARKSRTIVKNKKAETMAKGRGKAKGLRLHSLSCNWIINPNM